MTNVTKFFMQRPTLFWSLMIGILLMGTLAYSQMPKLEDPAVPVPQATVLVQYPGADAHTVELDVAQTMEEQLRTLPDVRKIDTECSNGTAMIGVEFERSVSSKELEQHFDILRRKVETASMMLPQGCNTIVIDDMMDVYGIFYALTADGYGYDDMERYAKFLRRRIMTVKGVKRVSIAGTRSDVINIEFDKARLSRNGLMPTQIMMQLQSASKVIDAGVIETGPDRFGIHITEGVNDIDDIRNLLISTPEGSTVRLGDIARIERTYASPQRNGFFVRGEPAIAICAALESDAIVPDVGKKIDQVVNETVKTLPAGIQTEKIFFQPDKVTDAVSSFLLNLLESVLIVVVVLIFAMGLRSGLIIGFGLLLTVALSFPILMQFGTTLQRISLGAFIVAMGMLVDNAVVIMDGILVDRKRGLPRDIYLYRIGKNTAMPLLGATIIAASTFLPIYLIPGSTGEFAGDLFLVICVSLIASWFLALVQVPVCANAWLPKTSGNTVSDRQTEATESAVHRFFRRTVATVIEYKKTALAISIAVLLIAGWGMSLVRNVFFPDFDYKQFVVECFFPAQSSPDEVKARMLAMSDSVSANPEIERVSMSMGGAPARYCLVRPMTSGGDRYGELIIDCKDFKSMQQQWPKVLQQLRKQFPDAYIRARRYNFSISSSHTVEVEYSGPDPAVLRQLADKAAAIMLTSPYVDPYSVENDWEEPNKEYRLEFSQTDAQRAGVSRSDVGTALKAAGDGHTVGALYDQDRIVPINITVRNADGSRISDINEIPVWSSVNINTSAIDPMALASGANSADDGKNALFRTATVGSVMHSTGLQWTEGLVKRHNGARAIQVECDPNPYDKNATPAKVMASIQQKIEEIPLPDGYSMRWVGENDVSGEAIEQLITLFPISIFIIFLVLLMLFNSWKKLTLILICFPFVIIGIAAALLITDTPFTFIAIIGFEGLVGMMIKNSIVLIDEINRLQDEEHQSVYNALINATVSRVRPVMMASLTTVFGMIPLISDPMYGSLAVTIIGGLTIGTIVTLILLPMFYSLFFHIKAPTK